MIPCTPCSIQSAVVFKQEPSTAEAKLRLRRGTSTQYDDGFLVFRVQCMLQPPASTSQEKHLIPTVLIQTI